MKVVRSEGKGGTVARIGVAAFVVPLFGMMIGFLFSANATKVSHDEGRTLSTMPQFSERSLVSGEYARAWEDYVRDHFPGRGRFLALSFWLRDHQGIALRDTTYVSIPVVEWAEEDTSARDEPFPTKAAGHGVAQNPKGPLHTETPADACAGDQHGIPLNVEDGSLTSDEERNKAPVKDASDAVNPGNERTIPATSTDAGVRRESWRGKRGCETSRLTALSFMSFSDQPNSNIRFMSTSLVDARCAGQRRAQRSGQEGAGTKAATMAVHRSRGTPTPSLRSGGPARTVVALARLPGGSVAAHRSPKVQGRVRTATPGDSSREDSSLVVPESRVRQTEGHHLNVAGGYAVASPGLGSHVLAAHAKRNAGFVKAPENPVVRETQKAIISKGIILKGNRAMQVFGGSNAAARIHAGAINAYRKAFPADIRVHALIAPSPAAYYLGEGRRFGSRPERPNLEALHSALSSGVIWSDVYSELEAHSDEAIFFRTDHHWTGLGAYYAYRSFCQAAGFRPVPLSSMSHKTRGSWLGSLYRYTKSEALRRAPDRVEYWVPPGTFVVRRFSSQADTIGHSHRLFSEGSSGYTVFLGGDYPLIVARNKLGTGRKALVVKNSFGNALAVYLVSHYDEVHIVDYRYLKGNLREYVEDNGITDVLLVNQIFGANTSFHAKKIKRVLNGNIVR